MIDFIREIFELSAVKVVAILAFMAIMIPVAAVILYYIVVIVGTVVVAAGVIVIAGLVVLFEKTRNCIVSFLTWLLKKRNKDKQ